MLKDLVQMGGFELNHHWHGINVLSLLECCLLAACLCTGLSLFARFVRKSRRLTALSLAGALSFATAAYAANTALSALSASGALAGANLIYVVQTAGVGGVKATMTQVATYINSLFSGDFTVTSGGVATLKNTGPGATGPIGSATTAPIVTIDPQGRVTALGSATITQPAAANPTATAGDVAVNGSASSFMRSDGAPAIQKASSSAFGVAKVDGSTITAAGGVLSAVAGGGTVTSVAAGCGTSTGGSPITTTGAVIAAMAVRANTATSDTIVAADCGNLLTESNASPVAVAIAQAGTTGFGAGAFFNVCNKGAGAVTITPATSTIGGAATYVLGAGTAAAPICVGIVSDGTNYQVVPSSGGTGSSGANPSATASDTAVNGAATTFMRSDGAPAVQKGSNAQFGLVEGDGTSVSLTSGVAQRAALTGDVTAAAGSSATTLAAGSAGALNSGNLNILRTASGVSHPGYGAGAWYPTYRSTSSANGPPAANTTIYCSIFQIGGNAAVTIQAIGVRTTANGTNLQLAIYNNQVTTSGSRPSTLVGATASINAASFGNLSGSISGGTVSVNPGFYWSCGQTDNASIRWQGGIASALDASPAYYTGASTLALVEGTTIASAVSAASGGFGTWPNLTGATFTELTSTSATGPALSIQTQ